MCPEFYLPPPGNPIADLSCCAPNSTMGMMQEKGYMLCSVNSYLPAFVLYTHHIGSYLLLTCLQKHPVISHFLCMPSSLDILMNFIAIEYSFLPYFISTFGICHATGRLAAQVCWLDWSVDGHLAPCLH